MMYKTIWKNVGEVYFQKQITHKIQEVCQWQKEM